MMRAPGLLLVLALAIPAGLPAQDDSASRRHAGTPPGATPSGERATFRRAVVHYGKWVAAAAAVTFTALGAREHDNSNREWGQLLALCRVNNADCLLGPDGRYLSPAPEALYQSSLTFDRRARVRLLAGQAALVAAATLFIVDLRHHLSRPGNIPYAPLEVSVAPGAGGTALVGVRVAF